MATYTEVGSGGAYGAGTSTKAFTAGTSRAAFLTNFVKGGVAYILQTDGTYKRTRINDYTVDPVWGSDGYFTTDAGTTIAYGTTAQSPEDRLAQLNIVYDINTAQRYYRYLNDLR